jgi:uncharacterized protein (DUF924 family)
MPDTSPAEIIAFWTDAGQESWYAKNDTFDAEIAARFRLVYEAARDGQLSSWEDSDDGALALLLVLDQFPRNLFRNDPRAYATDIQALRIARRAIAAGYDKALADPQRLFLYLPLEHSEDAQDQARGQCHQGAGDGAAEPDSR